MAGIFIILIAAVQLTTGYKFILAATTSVLVFPNLALLPHDVPLQYKLIINVYLLTGAILYATVSVARVKRLKQIAKLETAFAEQQEETERLARVDALTGLWNRRHFFELTKREIYRAGREGTLPGILLVLDIDHFKNINDSFGHACGDELLKHLARTWTGTLRESDILGRIGGEEFAIMLPATGILEGEQVAERIRQAAKGEAVCFNGFSCSATVSIGGVVIQQAETIDHALSRADRLLYEAKNSGRNCVKLQDDAPVSQG
ncbi:GGDEF domain-containing protein [Fodinicurvata halophila]|uniref:diguanylate cyclase n=1 Tax=Fodinicurvata halophila TaxID=1419723 RepID=A0ABV8UMU2_9PROT